MNVHFPETTLETPFGPVRVWATSADHLGASTGGQDEPHAITVNGVGYSLRVDLHPDAILEQRRPGGYRPASTNGWGIESGSIILRRDDFGGPTTSALVKVREVLVPFLARWATETPEGQELLAEAARHPRRQQRGAPGGRGAAGRGQAGRGPGGPEGHHHPLSATRSPRGTRRGLYTPAGV